jgi:hypothetical protein
MNSSLVHFEGHWSSTEQDPVIEASADVESTRSFTPSNQFDRPWVATHQSVGGHDLYMTTRQNTDNTLLDLSAAGLAERMRWLGRQMNADAGSARSRAEEEASCFQLIYASEATAPMSELDLHTLLFEARSRNDSLDVTGLLLHAHGQFLQLLEGDEATVRALYADIRDDPRHEDVRTLLTTETARRTFPDWSMNAEDVGPGDSESVAAPVLRIKTVPSSLKSVATVLEALQKFQKVKA